MSCQKESVDGYNFDIGFRFEVSDANGINFLNPVNANAFQANQIDIYYLIDGEKQRVYNGNLDYPENFSIEVDESTDRYFMSLDPNSRGDGNTTVTYIK